MLIVNRDREWLEDCLGNDNSSNSQWALNADNGCPLCEADADVKRDIPAISSTARGIVLMQAPSRRSPFTASFCVPATRPPLW